MSMSFATDLWNQFEEVHKKSSAGKEFATAVADFMHKRAAIEREYSKKLQTICKTFEKESGSLCAGWNSVKEETENISKKHGELGEFLNFQIEEPLQNFLKETKKTRQSLRAQGQKVIKDLQTAESKVASAKLTFEQARKKQDETTEEYERAAFTNQQSPAVEKLNKKMRAEAKKAQMCDKKYSEAVDSCRLQQDKFYDDEMPRILADYQKMEELRLDRLQLVLGAYVELQRSVSPEIIASCDRMDVLVNNINPKADVQAFIQEKRNDEPRPERVVYENYNAELGRCVKKETSMPASTPVQTKTIPAAAAPHGSRSSPQQRRQEPTGRKGISKCRGLFDYTPDDPNELPFKQGDIITVLQKDPSGWWQGELNGRIGAFPSVDWVEEFNPGPSKCRALYDYTADSDYELTIKAGDILTIEGDEGGWYNGRNLRGQSGRYPANYVQPI